MNKWVYILGNTIVAICILCFFLLVGLVGWTLHANSGISTLAATGFVAFFVVPTMLFVYILYRSNKNNSREDLKREQELLDDVGNSGEGRYLNTKSILGKWYSFSFVAVICFSVASYVIGFLVSDPEIEMNIIMALGYITIFFFILGILFSRKNRKH